MPAPNAVFNPHRSSIEDLQRITVSREELIQRIHDSLRLGPDERGTPHWLVVGSRGMGKTHLLLVLFQAVRTDPQTSTIWVTLQLREEEYWRAHSMATFMRGLVTHLREAWEPQDDDGTGTAALREAEQSLAGLVSGEEMLVAARGALEKFHRLTGRRILIGAENLDALLSQLKNAEVEGRILRDILQHSSHIALVATTITTRLGTEVSTRGNPFYRFFRVEQLRRFDFDELLQQLHRMQSVDRDPLCREKVARFLGQRQDALRILHHLSGGNPRLGVLLYGVLAGPETLVEAIDLLHALLDLSTPYFQDRMRDLAPQERPIAAAFCEAEETLTGAEVARIVGMDRNVVYSLLRRLEQGGFLERVELASREGGGTLLQVSEDLFRMWWQFRFNREHMVRRVVRFLAVAYEGLELEDVLGRLAGWIEKPDDAPFAREAIDRCREYVMAAMNLRQDTSDPQMRSARIEELQARRARREIGADDLVDLARLLVEDGQHEKAAQAALEATKRDPTCFLAWTTLGASKVATNDHAGAEDVWHQALEQAEQVAQTGRVAQMGPLQVLLRTALGLACHQQGKDSEAQLALEQAVQQDPNAAQAWYALGKVLLAKGDLSEAAEALGRAVQLDDNNADAWHCLGLAQNNLGQRKQACASFERATALRPDLPDAWFYVAVCRMAMHDLDGAESATDQGKMIAPDSPNLVAMAAVVKAMRGDAEGVHRVIGEMRGGNASMLQRCAPLFLTGIADTAFAREAADLLAGDPERLEGSKDDWHGLVDAAGYSTLSNLDIHDAAAIQERLDLLDRLASLREELAPLRLLKPVLRYFQVMLAPPTTRSGRKLTPRQRGQRVLARVPREQRDAVQRQIRELEARASRQSKPAATKQLTPKA